jgi:hypothetical protein
MTGLNFREIFERVDRLYAQKQYAPAYALLTQGAERLPEWATSTRRVCTTAGAEAWNS